MLIRRLLKGKECLGGAPFVPSVPATLLTDGTVSRLEAWFRAVWRQKEMHWSLSDLRVGCGSPAGVEKGSARVERWAQAILLCGERGEMCFHWLHNSNLAKQDQNPC